MKRRRSITLLFSLCAIFAAGSLTVHGAITVRLDPTDIGLGSYDSSVDGFGAILTGFDLSTLDLSLAGVTLDVTTTNIGGSGQITADSNSGNGWLVLDASDTTSITYSFNSAVDFAWTSNVSGDPFGTTATRTFLPGEIDTFSGSGGTFTPLNPSSFDAGLTVGASSIQNGNATGSILQGYAFVSNATTSITWTHDDTIGAFEGQRLTPWVGAVPEPSRALLSLVGIAAIGLRRRRS